MLHPARKEYSPILCQSRATGSAWSPGADKPGAFRAYGLTVGNHGDLLLGEVQITLPPKIAPIHTMTGFFSHAPSSAFHTFSHRQSSPWG